MTPDGRMVTIREVARAAGVGISTVSRALNNSGPVHTDTKEKILRIAIELGFRPNAVAKSMVTRSTGTLGLLIPDLRNPYFPAVTRGVEDMAARHGFTVMLGNSDNDPTREWKFIRTLLDKQVDGIILISTAVDIALVRQIIEAGTPICSMDVGHSGLADVVRVDQSEAARQATRHLIALGHRRIAHIAAPSWTRTGRERMQGYRTAMSEAGLSISSTLIQSGNWLDGSGSQAARELMAQAIPPTAIYAANDLMAIGAMVWLTEHGFRVPADVAVMGHGNVPFSALVTPPLTSMAESEYQVGELAAEMLIQRRSGTYTGPNRVRTLPHQIVIRKSCGAELKGEETRGTAKTDHTRHRPRGR
jgi:LacI family transcriptional regulator